MKKVLIILNPRAGKMKSKGGLFTIVDKLCAAGWNVTVQTTQKQGHATELAADAAVNGFDLIVCCGGDGTLNEVIDGVMNVGSDIPLGYIPCGSTNDFAASMGISTNINKAIENIIANDTVSLDIGSFNGRHFSYIASFGAFTAASYSAPQSRKNALGHFAYILEGIKDIKSLKKYHMTVKTDDICEEGDYIFGAVSNSTSVGGIVKLNADLVDMKDGIFELILIKYPKNPAQLSRILTGILKSNFDKDVFTFTKTSRVEFDTDSDIHWTLDGEYEKGASHIEVLNIHEAIKLKK